MIWAKRKYDDRFGNRWLVDVTRKPGQRASVTFTCGEFRLIADQGGTDGSIDATPARLADLFRSAERMLDHDGEQWRVGYRSGVAVDGRPPAASLHTWFRSGNGEVRSAPGMLQFRHMPRAELCAHLQASVRVVGGRPRVRWSTSK